MYRYNASLDAGFSGTAAGGATLGGERHALGGISAGSHERRAPGGSRGAGEGRAEMGASVGPMSGSRGNVEGAGASATAGDDMEAMEVDTGADGAGAGVREEGGDAHLMASTAGVAIPNGDFGKDGRTRGAEEIAEGEVAVLKNHRSEVGDGRESVDGGGWGRRGEGRRKIVPGARAPSVITCWRAAPFSWSGASDGLSKRALITTMHPLVVYLNRRSGTGAVCFVPPSFPVLGNVSRLACLWQHQVGAWTWLLPPNDLPNALACIIVFNVQAGNHVDNSSCSASNDANNDDGHSLSIQ